MEKEMQEVQNCESQQNIIEVKQENLQAAEKNNNDENPKLQSSSLEVKQENLQSAEVNYNEENCGLLQSSITECKPESLETSIEVIIIEESCKLQQNGMEDVQEIVEAPKGNNEENCGLLQSSITECKPESLETSIEVIIIEESFELQQNGMEDVQEIVEAPNRNNEENCELQQSFMEDVQEIPEAPKGSNNEENCKLQQSFMEDVQEIPEAPKGSNNDENCELRENVTENVQEILQAPKGNSDVPVGGMVQNSTIVIDVSGQSYEDNITDRTRREPVISDSDSDTESVCSSASISSLSSFSSLEDITDTIKSKKEARPANTVKTRGELGIEDLPPVEELMISVPEDDMQKIGTVFQIVDQLVVVESFLNSPALDFDTVLFLSHGKPLGHIFEVFGPVKQPYYLIRFNSNEEIVKNKIAKEDSVFYAPSHSNITSFIFTSDLMKQKGSDASWEHNNEPPEEHLDYSDDEMEKAARRKRIAKNRRPDADETQNHKRVDLSTEAKSDAASSISGISSSKSNNYFTQGRKSSASTNYPYRDILKPSANLKFHTHRQGVVNQNRVVTPRYKFSQDLSFSQTKPRPFHHGAVLQSPFTSPPTTLSRYQFPGSQLPCVQTINQDIQGDEKQGVNQNPMVDPQDRISRHFQCFQPRPIQQSPVSPATASYSGNHRFPVPDLPFVQPNNQEFQVHGKQVVNESTVATPQHKIPGNFPFYPPRLPQFRPSQPATLQQSPVSPAAASYSANHQFTGSPLSSVQTNVQEYQCHEKQVANENTVATPQHRIPGNFLFSPPRPPQSRPPQQTAFQQSTISSAPATISGNHQFSGSPLPFVQTNNQKYQGHERQDINENMVAAPQHGIPGNFMFLQPRPPHPTAFQQSPVPPAPATNSGNHQFPLAHFVQAKDQDFQSHVKQGINENLVNTPQYRFSENFIFPQPRPPHPTAFQQNTVPSAPSINSGNNQFSSPFVQAKDQTFQGHERRSNENIEATPQYRISENFLFSQPMPRPPQPTGFQQSSVSPAPATNSGSHQFPSSPLLLVQTNNQRFLGHENREVNQKTIVEPQHSISGNFPFSAPRTLPARPRQQNTVPSSPDSYDWRLSFIRPNNQPFHTGEKAEVGQNPQSAHQFSISANLPFSQLPPSEQTAIQQRPVSAIQPTSYENNQFPGSHLFIPSNNLRFQGHANQRTT